MQDISLLSAAPFRYTETHCTDVLRVSVCVCVCVWSVRLHLQMSLLGHWGALLLRSDGSGAEQGPSHRTQIEQVERRAGRQAGSAAVWWAEEGTAQRHCGQEAARITLGVLVWGGMTPTGVKEEGSVWRRKEEKKPSKPDKASEKQCEDCRRKRRRRRERRSFQQRNAHWWILWHFASGSCSLVYFNPRSTSLVAANFLFSWQVRGSGTLGMFCALEETWWRGGKFRGTAVWFSALFSKDNACKVGFLCMALDYTAPPVWNISSDLSWCRLIVE